MNGLIDFREKLYAAIERFEDLKVQGKVYMQTIDIIRLLERMVGYIDRRIEHGCADRTMEDW